MLRLDHIVWHAPGGERVLAGIDLTLPDGKLVAITGPNGGGKTTIAKLIAGLETPASGRIFLDGEDITSLDITERAQKGISYAFQQPVRFKGLTVRDLIHLAAGETLSHDQLCQLLQRVGLCAQDYLNREVDASLSGGEIKRIEIATVLARAGKFTLFDEPEAGIDLWSFTSLIDVFSDMRRHLHGCLVVISHQERILSIADEIVVVAGGVIQEQGPRQEILPALLAGGQHTANCPKPRGGIFS